MCGCVPEKTDPLVFDYKERKVSVKIHFQVNLIFAGGCFRNLGSDDPKLYFDGVEEVNNGNSKIKSAQ